MGSDVAVDVGVRNDSASAGGRGGSGVAVSVGVAVGSGVLVGVDVLVAVTTMMIGVCVGAGDGEGVGEGVADGVGVGVSVGETWADTPDTSVIQRPTPRSAAEINLTGPTGTSRVRRKYSPFIAMHSWLLALTREIGVSPNTLQQSI